MRVVVSFLCLTFIDATDDDVIVVMATTGGDDTIESKKMWTTMMLTMNDDVGSYYELIIMMINIEPSSCHCPTTDNYYTERFYDIFLAGPSLDV